MSFDWQTEEFERDNNAQVPKPSAAEDRLYAGPDHATEPAIQPARIIRSHRRRPLLLFGLALIVVAMASLFYWQIDRRIAEGRRRVEAEILATHETVLSAARLGDAELFVSFLSGRDPKWAAEEEQLVRKRIFGDRAAFGLTQPAMKAAMTMIPTLELAPDLRSAELIAPQQYIVGIGKGLTETITLEQTLIYRQGPDRWLLAPPDTGFWGETKTTNGRFTRLTYPARDADLAIRLAQDMEATLAELCADLTDDCYTLTIRLTTDPAVFEEYTTLTDQMRGGSEVVLPTPALFGTPLGEASYRAVSRQYVARVVGAAVANYTGWACCDDLVFYTALHQALLNQLGLKAWEVAGQPYEPIDEGSVALSVVQSLWRVKARMLSISELKTLHAFVDFLVYEGRAMPIVEMQRLLLDDREWVFWDWLSLVTGGKYGSPVDFERAWLRFATSREASPAIPITVPSDLQGEGSFIFVANAIQLNVSPQFFGYNLSTGAKTNHSPSASNHMVIGAPIQVLKRHMNGKSMD